MRFFLKKTKLKKNFKKTTQTQNKTINKQIKLQNFKIKDKVIFFIKNIIKIRFKKKLLNKYTKIFEIFEKIKKQIY